jgi:hypothetical protein
MGIHFNERLINRAVEFYEYILLSEYDIQFQAELEESNQKEGPEIEEAQSTIKEVEELFQTTEA